MTNSTFCFVASVVFYLFVLLVLANTARGEPITVEVKTYDELSAAIGRLAESDVICNVSGRIEFPKGGQIISPPAPRSLAIYGRDGAEFDFAQATWSGDWEREPAYPPAQGLVLYPKTLFVRGIAFRNFNRAGNVVVTTKLLSSRVRFESCRWENCGVISFPPKSWPLVEPIPQQLVFVSCFYGGASERIEFVKCEFIDCCRGADLAHCTYTNGGELVIAGCKFIRSTNCIGAALHTGIVRIVGNTFDVGLSLTHTWRMGGQMKSPWILYPSVYAPTIFRENKVAGRVRAVVCCHSSMPSGSNFNENDYRDVIFSTRCNDTPCFFLQLGGGGYLSWHDWRAMGFDADSDIPLGMEKKPDANNRARRLLCGD